MPRKFDTELFCSCEDVSTDKRRRGIGYFCKCDLNIRDRFSGELIHKVLENIILHSVDLQTGFKETGYEKKEEGR